MLGGGGCAVTVVSRVVVVVVSGELEQETSVKPTSNSAEMRIIDFFMIIELPLLTTIRHKLLLQMY